jgi:hypothetical protein
MSGDFAPHAHFPAMFASVMQGHDFVFMQLQTYTVLSVFSFVDCAESFFPEATSPSEKNSITAIAVEAANRLPMFLIVIVPP